jgi:predicted Zn-dependent protease
VVRAGSSDPGAMLEGVRRGLFVERVSGSVDPSTRRFDLVVESGRVISRGVCRGRVRGLRIRGETRQALHAVRAVGCDVTVSREPVWCGRRGTVLTGVAGPTVLMAPLEVVS